MAKEEGLRFNEGKSRYDLIPTFANKQLAEILTKGSLKYAPRNWEKGMNWSKCIASLKRHLQAFETGEDFDKESGQLHIAHVMCNAAFLTEYYKIYPQGDDRQHSYLNQTKIGLDIDGVLGDFNKHLMDYCGLDARNPHSWSDPVFIESFEKVKKDSKFWLSMPMLTKPTDIGFEPHCYITARSIDASVTEEWLNKNGYPAVPLYCVGHDQSKVDVAKSSGIDLFVDDRMENFVELNKAGICTFLFDSPHNRKYEVGYKRIKQLNDLI